MTTTDLSIFIKDQAKKLGFEACGIARATRIPESEIRNYHFYLQQNHHAEMHYMEKNTEKRYDPRLLVEDCRSVIVVALNYEPTIKQHPNTPKIARFAYGKDYHPLLKNKLNQLLQTIKNQGIAVNGRAFTDSAPVAERYWAYKSGIGWIGKNHQLILPNKGSFFFLGELMIDLELNYDSPLPNRCGKCQRCLDACPSNALTSSGLDARRCISYLTIEKRGILMGQEAKWIAESNSLMGCDICQNVCPWNRFAKGNSTPELNMDSTLLSMRKEDFEKLNTEDFKVLFKGTCMERTGYTHFRRNLNAIEKPDHP